MKKPKSKKPKKARRKTAEEKATGGWGREMLVAGAAAESDDGSSRPLKRRQPNQAQTDRADRLKRRQLEDQSQRAFEAKMKRPLLQRPQGPSRAEKQQAKLLVKRQRWKQAAAAATGADLATAADGDDVAWVKGGKKKKKKRRQPFASERSTPFEQLVQSVREEGDEEGEAENDTSTLQEQAHSETFAAEQAPEDEAPLQNADVLSHALGEAYDRHFSRAGIQQPSAPLVLAPLADAQQEHVGRLGKDWRARGWLPQHSTLEVAVSEQGEDGPSAAVFADANEWQPASHSLKRVIGDALASYCDVLLATHLVPSSAARQQVFQSVAEHVCGSVLWARKRVCRHNQRLRRASAVEQDERADSDSEEEQATARSTGRKIKSGAGVANLLSLDGGDEEEDAWKRDQGFTRPRVLLLAPTRHVAWQVVEAMVMALGEHAMVHNLERFRQEFGPPEEDEEEEDESEGGACTHGGGKGKNKPHRRQRPADWQELFGGNNDDEFKLGLALTPAKYAHQPKKGKPRGHEARLFTEFYQSDVIVASPLGLCLAVGPADAPKQDFDMLSSIEVAVVLDGDALAQQNFDHVQRLASLLNQPLQQDRATDFSRVRPWCLEHLAGRFRQTVVLSALLEPNVLGLFRRDCHNHAGKIRLREVVLEGAATRLEVPVKQLFHKLTCDSLLEADEVRFNFFVETLLPKLNSQERSLVFIPQYFDFVRVRNLLVERGVSFVAVHEYSRQSEVSRSRARFFRGQRPIMLYSGRAHFFWRYHLRGARHLVLYGLPDHPVFYSEILAFLQEAVLNGEAATCQTAFTQYDQLALERVLGCENANSVLQSKKDTFLFY